MSSHKNDLDNLHGRVREAVQLLMRGADEKDEEMKKLESL